MRQQKGKKWILVLVVVIIVIGLGKGCMKEANKELLQSVSLTTIEIGTFEQTYETLGKIVPKQSVHQPIEGPILKTYVKVGDEVKKNDALIKYQWGKEEKTLKSKLSGVVYSLTQQEIELVAKEQLWLWFEVPQSIQEQIKEKQVVHLQNKSAEIESIAKVAHQGKEGNCYDVYASLSSFEDVMANQEVNVTISINDYLDVYILPSDAVLTLNGTSYVIKEQWLNHPMEIRPEDWIQVSVLGMQNGKVVIAKQDSLQERVCVFSGISLSFIQELLRSYL